MTNHDDAPGEDPAVDQTGITLAFEKLPRGKVRVRAQAAGRLFHCDTIRVEDSKQRARFADQVAARALADLGLEVEAGFVERNLLAIVEGMAGREGEGDPPAPARYHAVEGRDDPGRDGLYVDGADGPVRLTNFTASIDRDVTVQDGDASTRRFEGRVTLLGVTSTLAIGAEDYASGHKLAAAIFKAAGPKAQVLCRPEVLCLAVSAVSEPAATVASTDFGWTEARDAYLAPSARVDAAGIHPLGPGDPDRVALDGEQCARHLDLAAPGAGEIAGLGRHVIDDLLALHDRRVTFTLLAAVALAVLFPFVSGMNRPALWLVGPTGGGKSFAAKLFQSFFGDFPVELGSAVGSWSSTANFLQRQGYFFKDAMYLVDDYKPDVTRQGDVLRLLQNYADGAARGRLNADATTNVSRAIRGILACTGEATPESSPSALARTVVVRVPARTKDLARGKRCLALRPRYRALMADFVRHVIAEGRGAAFAGRVGQLQDTYYGPIAGVQNDLRIAGNLALLGAAFEEFAAYLADADPAWGRDCRDFIGLDLPAIRDEMVASVKEQQPSEIFLATLRSLLEHGRVALKGWMPSAAMNPERVPTIGRAIGLVAGEPAACDICTSLALEAVQESLRRQGRPPLATTERALLDQLAGDGKLLGGPGSPPASGAGARRTRDVNIEGSTRKAFRIAAVELIDPVTYLPRPPRGVDRVPPIEATSGPDGGPSVATPHAIGTPIAPVPPSKARVGEGD